MSDPSIKALLLRGGRSSRMGRDKAELRLAGEDGPTLGEHALAALATVADETFVSVAGDDTRTYDVPSIRDRVESKGPLAGLEAAFAADPDSAWLLLACDLPNIGEGELAVLCSGRDPACDATAFRSPVDEVPEPLCAIYEPSARESLRPVVEGGQRCARRFLASLRVQALPAPSPDALQNWNRPEDVAEWRERERRGSVPRSVTLEYFGSLREEAGVPREVHTSAAATLAGLWDELRLLRNFRFGIEGLRAAVNDELAPWTAVFNEGDRIAFLPPFAGG